MLMFAGGIVRDGLLESLSNYEKDEAARRAWDYFQREFRCCGADNYTDWRSHYQVNRQIQILDTMQSMGTWNLGCHGK